MSAVASKVDYWMLERYSHEYHLSLVLGIQVLSSSSSILDAPPGKVGFYLQHLACGLWLPPSCFFLEVLCFYKVHLIQLFLNAVSKIVTFEVFCVAHEIPLDVSLFHYFYRLKKYGDWFSFCIRHFPLSPDLVHSSRNWKNGSKFSFQLTAYLGSDIPPKSIVVDDVVPDQNVDQVTVTLESPLALPGGCCLYVLFKEELNEACRFITREEKIFSSMLGQDLQFFYGLLTLQNRFLAAVVNVRIGKGMNLFSEEMLLKAGEMYVINTLSGCCGQGKVFRRSRDARPGEV
ncbi:unnamed protein product [Lactuca virosa]|uniref:Transposase (putative) gypsy type domain-containing protein n=1 Tax=Lactuca virosa TaxID=75947 RepID=A0AAU9M6H8_9ASTR|nr:unnamed protein product [Lactuca virosa]